MKHIIRLSVILITLLLFNNTFAAENITGTWQGKLVIAPETELKIQFNISQNADGSYAVILNSPEEGGIKDVKANSVAFDSGNLKLEVAELSGTYDGVVKDGKIEGTWKQEGTSMPLSLSPYVKPTLTREDKEKLLGSWNGPLNFPGGSITAVYRFEMTEDGEILGFAESPDQGAFNTPVTDLEMENGILTIKVEAWQTEFKGRMEGDEIIGEFKQRGQALPLTLKKGEYTKAARTEISLAVDILSQYEGTYELAPGKDMMVTLEGEQLISQITGQGTVPIFAETETQFFPKVVDATIEFFKDDKGAISHLILRQGGRELAARRAGYEKEPNPIDGTWTATFDGPDGKPLEVTYVFEGLGKTLLGTVNTSMGGGPFSEGTIDGNKISFFVRIDPSTILVTTGTVFGDEISLSQQNGNNVTKLTAKRISK